MSKETKIAKKEQKAAKKAAKLEKKQTKDYAKLVASINLKRKPLRKVSLSYRYRFLPKRKHLPL